MSMCASWCIFSASLYPLSFPIDSPVFPITLVILLPVEIVSKRHFRSLELTDGLEAQFCGLVFAVI